AITPRCPSTVLRPLLSYFGSADQRKGRRVLHSLVDGRMLLLPELTRPMRGRSPTPLPGKVPGVKSDEVRTTRSRFLPVIGERRTNRDFANFHDSTIALPL